MKHLIKLCSFTAIGCAFAATTVFAQTNTFSFDENGKGVYNGIAIAGGLVPVDPSGGVAGPVLIYTVPGAVQLTVGDVVLNETAVGGNTNVSDVVRFWEFNQVIFYSDRESGGAGDSDLADISGLPSFLLSNQVNLLETGTEGSNGAFYLAGPGLPGWDGSPIGTRYQIISDVPEPGSVLLSSLCGGLLLMLRRRGQGRRI